MLEILTSVVQVLGIICNLGAGTLNLVRNSSTMSGIGAIAHFLTGLMHFLVLAGEANAAEPILVLLIGWSFALAIGKLEEVMTPEQRTS